MGKVDFAMFDRDYGDSEPPKRKRNKVRLYTNPDRIGSIITVVGYGKLRVVKKSTLSITISPRGKNKETIFVEPIN